MRLRTLAVLACMAAPWTAHAAEGLATAEVNMRAGPGTNYPVVTTIARAAAVEIHACLAATDWCDVAWSGSRGWVAARYLAIPRSGRDGGPMGSSTPPRGLPVATFAREAYWQTHYRNKPVMGRLSRWESRFDRRQDRLSEGQFGRSPDVERLQRPAAPLFRPAPPRQPFDAGPIGRGNPGRTPLMQPGSRRGLY